MKYRAIGFSLFAVLLCAMSAAAQEADALGRAAAYEPLMIEAGARYGVDPRLLWTVAYLETRFQHYDERGRINTSPAGAKGLMQFMPTTAARYGLREPFDETGSIHAAARYLRDLQALFGNRLDLVLAAYNAGEGAVIAFRDGRKLALSNGKVINPNGLKTGGVPPYRETWHYVNNGVAIYLRLAEKKWPAPMARNAKRQRLGLPERARPKEPAEPAPEEITQLKQGSIYIVASAAAGEVSVDSPSPVIKRPPQNPTTRSIYSQR